MRKVLPLFFLFLIITGFIQAQCTTNVDFNTWTKGGNPGNGNWVVQNGGSQVHQTVNGDPTFFYSPFDLMNVHITGNFKSTDGDNDYMGFVFSFLNPLGATDSFDCWLYDWKQSQQDAAPGGMSLNRCLGVLPSSTYTPQFWDHTNNAAFTCVANHFGGPGWVQGFNHAFELYLTYTEAKIYIDGTLQFDWHDCYKVGRFGFYNLSQQDCYYSNFQYSLYIDFTSPPNACNNTSVPFTFIPTCAGSSLTQYQSVKWDFGDGTTNVISNPTTTNVNVNHTYATNGSYTVTLSVTDNNGCSASQSHTVVVKGPINLSPTLTPPPCNGGSNGTVAVTATNGFGNYAYTWNNGTHGASNPGVGAGTYTVTVTDGSCNASAQYTLSQPTALTATTSETDASCGLANGSATIAISGGTPPYAGVNWAGTPGYTVTGLVAGTYIADFHDANGCSALLQYTATVGSTPCGITSSVSSTDVACYGSNTGQATLNVTGTTGTAVITWSNGATGATASNLVAGTYTFTYTDGDPAHNFNGSVVIHQPTGPITLQLATNGIVCPGSTDGQATASVSAGGVAPFHYAWSRNNHDNPVDTGLSPGAITVTVTDASGCTATATGNISSVPSLTATFVTTMDSCFHSGKGKAIVTVNGGNPPYTYNWSNFNADTVTNNLHLFLGTYTLTVTDSRNCSITSSATITGPPSSLLTVDAVQSVACYGGNTGSINVTTTGGTPGYTYVWDHGLSGTSATGLSAGVYNFTVTDVNNCTFISGDSILQPDSALTAVTSHINVSCYNGSDGALIVTIAGGTPPYNYNGFTIPPGTDTIPNLTAMNYVGQIMDANHCAITINETISQPGLQNLTFTTVDNTCYGASGGTITANFVNATGGVTYNWSPGGVLPPSRNGLVAGIYNVTGTDSKNCTVSNIDTITQPTAIVIAAQVTNVKCFGDATGSISLTVSGGTGATYGYTWNPNVSTTASATALTAGTYNITVTDQANCTADTLLNVTQPTAALGSTVVANDISCNGAHDGNVTFTPTGGTSGYTYVWNPNVSTTNSATGLTANTYAVTITDANSCTAINSATIIEPTVLSLTQSQTDLLCYHINTGVASVSVTGGTQPYSYSWNPNVSITNSATNIAAGAYSVTVSDNHLCTITASFNLSEPPQFTVAEAPTEESCYGDATGNILLTPTGGTGAYSYTWIPNVSTGNAASNLAAGSYAYTVSDANNCSVTNTVTITQPGQIVLTPAVTNPLCYNLTGAIATSIAGGNSPFNYSLEMNGGSVQTSTTGQFTGVNAGTYTINVTDANSCTSSAPAVVTAPLQLFITTDSNNVTCYGLSNGALNINPTGGVPGYTFSLSNGASNSSGIFSGLVAGNYTVTITDANNCSTTHNINITQPDSFVISVSPAQSTVKMGDTLHLHATANQPDSVTYSWTPSLGLSCNGCADPVFSSNYSTVYNITGTSANGCDAVYSIEVTVIPDYNLFIPNVFTPNGDGKNDVWQIFGDMHTIKQFTAKVFDRWGEKVYEGRDVNAGWDGTFKGSPAPLGVYTYEISIVWLDNRSDDHLTGSITLLR